ncbi:6031_t:CDS:2 [Cetraspora pellucida]|uniref:6031_t:CDS:1 n=1 Tax=Cetraspora pellucida TaxID=1433469 RepID=A0A9N9DGC3_9GLOM|nr:6031_t:CDS:2 [Cetraspora pellucida]
MVYISTNETEDDPTVKDVTYSGFNMQSMRANLESSIENFWQCIKVKSNDYIVKEETDKINFQREKFLSFIEGSIQQSHEIRKYVSNLQLLIKSFSDQPISDDNHRSLKSLLDDTERNLKSSEKLKDQANMVKDELVDIRNNLNKYKNDVQNDSSNIRSKTKDEFDKVNDEIKSSTTTLAVGSAAAGIGAVLTAVSVALAPFTAGASIAIEAAIFGIIGGSAAIGGGAAVAIKEGMNRPTRWAKSGDIKEKLEQERKDLTVIIDKMEEDLKSIIITIGQLVGYWENQTEIVSDLLDKVNETKTDGKVNNLVVRAIDKSLKELELDELYAKDFCVTIRGLLAKDQTESKTGLVENEFYHFLLFIRENF